MIKIAVDSGTTNCRVKFLQDGKVLRMERSSVGIKDVAASGNSKILEDTIRERIEAGLQAMGLTFSDVEYVVGSGMITSNLGLLEIPHLTAPADYKVFAKALRQLDFPWLQGVPFYLIPGMKNDTAKTLDHLADIDVMRGEEVETFGAIEGLPLEEETLVVLPGSHTKFVMVDAKGQMTGCITTMLGELFSALVECTILKDALPEGLIESVDADFVRRGVAYQGDYGLSNAAFATRLLQIQLDTTPNQRANFIGGALVADDINPKITEDLKKGRWRKVVVGGASPLRELFVLALKEKGLEEEQLLILQDAVTKHAPAMGAVKIVDHYLSTR